MFRVALLSRWHPHAFPDARYAKDLLNQPDCSIVAVWDRDEALAREWGEFYGVDFYTDLEAVLSREDVDGVLVCSDPKNHKEILISAANHGKHIFTEKVLAFSVEEAEEIKAAVERNHVQFCISFMRLAIPQLAYARKLLEDGTLGKPVAFRCMCGHAGAIAGSLPDYWYDPDITGGGAMIDLGFNSAYLARYIMGEFESVSSTFSYDIIHKPVEDTASCNVKFKNGAIGDIEATFVSPLISVFELNVYGTKGAYYARFGGGDMAELNVNGKREVLDLSALNSPLKTPIATWVDACRNGCTVNAYGMDGAIDMVKYMKAAYESAREDGKRIRIG